MPKTPVDDRPFLSRAALIKRGWTATLIASFLGQPDKYAKNPHYKTGPQINLFLLERIEQTEKLPSFVEAKSKTDKRKQSSAKAIETKTATTLAIIRTGFVVKLPDLTREELERKAIDSRNRFLQNLDSYEHVELLPSPEYMDEKHLHRICVNYLRHNKTKYDRYIDRLEGKVGIDEALTEMRAMIFAAIAEKFHWLAEECERQREGDEDI